jgi:hypothetical protein
MAEAGDIEAIAEYEVILEKDRQLRNNGAKVQYESCIDEENKRELMQYLVLIMCRS